MRKTGLIFTLLLAISTAFCQVFRMDIQNEPLSKVLNMLDVEISFDPQSVASYRVSVSKSFENPEKALLWLLEDKPLSIKKIGNVYVIVPYQDKQQQDENVTRYINEESFYYTGTILSQSTGEHLEYAIVSLLDKENQTLVSGITSGKGQFFIQTRRRPLKIKISYLGYETQINDIYKLNEDLGVFTLKETAIELNETVVTADYSRENLIHTTYIITQNMRAGADNALDLLDNIPGVFFDKSSKSVQLNHQENILLLVDGIQYSQTYINHLSPKRIQSVEIINSLSGRFVSDDHAGIINFVLKKDYSGFDFKLSNTASLNLSSKNQHNRWTENHPAAGITYTTSKMNLFGMYEYDNENRNMYTSKKLTYNQSELDFIPANRPNDLYKREIHTISGGFNYRLTHQQHLGVKADFLLGNTYTLEEHTMRRTDPSNNYDKILTNTTTNKIEMNTFLGSIFYQGQVSNRIRLFGDFTYNYYFNNMNNEYKQDYAANYRYFDEWDEYKNQTALNLESKYNLSDHLSMDAGYSNIRRQYASSSSQGKGFLDYLENRNKVFTYLSCSFSNKTGMKAGIALEHIKQQNGESASNYLRILPYLTVNHKINRHVILFAGYSTSQSYPSLYQISPMNIVIDTFLIQIGNPVLKSAVRHHTFIELALWKKIKLTPQLTITKDGVSEIYDIKSYKLYRTFENVNVYDYSLHASYNRMFGTYFCFKNSVRLYYSEVSHQGIRNSVNGWMFQSEVEFNQPEAFFVVQLGYIRNMKKKALWQGYQMFDKDYWHLTARKEFLHNRLSVLLSYIPPVRLGVRYDRVKEMNTPFYKEKTVKNLESHNQMLLLKVGFRFDSGKEKNAERRNENINYEHER